MSLHRWRLNGAPVVVVKQAKQLGTSGDLILTSLSGYATAVSAVDEALSMHVLFDRAESEFRFVVEIDGAPWLSSALTPANGGDSQSHAIILS